MGSYLSAFAWLIVLVYFLFINKALVLSGTFQNQKKVASNIFVHYTPLTIILAIAALITGVMIMADVVHIAKLKSLNTLNKIGYIVFLVFTGPIAILYIWFTLLKKEPKDVAMYPDIK